MRRMTSHIMSSERLTCLNLEVRLAVMANCPPGQAKPNSLNAVSTTQLEIVLLSAKMLKMATRTALRRNNSTKSLKQRRRRLMKCANFYTKI